MSKYKRRIPGITEKRIKSIPPELIEDSLPTPTYVNKLPKQVEAIDRKLGYELSYRVSDSQTPQISIMRGVTPEVLRAIADDLSDRIKTGLYKGRLVDTQERKL